MAISFVGSTNTTVADQVTFNFALPTCLENDIVVVVVGSSSVADDPTIGVTTSGYTEETELYSNDSMDSNFSVSWKRMGATPDTSVDCEGTGGTSLGTTAIAYVLRGVDTTTAIDVTTTTATGGNSSIPNCPSITPTTEGAWVVACGVGAEGDSSITAPTGYTNHHAQTNNVPYDHTVAVCSKAWSGSGAEDPAPWTDWTTGTSYSWCAATLAFRPVALLTPPSGELTLTGTTPAVSTAPSSAALTITGGTPDMDYANPALPSSGTLTLTGGTPTPHAVPSVFPTTGQMQLTGGTPTVPDLWRLDVTLPAISAQFEALRIEASLNVLLPAVTTQFNALGAIASLEVTLPPITFWGKTGLNSNLLVELPVFEALLGTGSGLQVELPGIDTLLTSVTGSTCTLSVDLPEILFSSRVGVSLEIELPEIESLFTGVVGRVGRLVVTLPSITSLFEAQVETLATLNITLPGIQSLFTGRHDPLSGLHVTLPPITCRMNAYAGGIASLGVTLPEIAALFTSYEAITGQLVVTLPSLRAYLEASQGGRFDTATAAQLESTILKWSRSCPTA